MIVLVYVIQMVIHWWDKRDLSGIIKKKTLQSLKDNQTKVFEIIDGFNESYIDLITLNYNYTNIRKIYSYYTFI